MAMDYVWLADKLTGEYKEVFEKAELFACLRKIEEDEQNEMLMDLLDVLLTAQEEKRPVWERVLGFFRLRQICRAMGWGCVQKTNPGEV